MLSVGQVDIAKLRVALLLRQHKHNAIKGYDIARLCKSHMTDLTEWPLTDNAF